MEINNSAIQIGIILAVILILSFFFKIMEAAWKLLILVVILLGLSFAFPDVRQWIMRFF